MKVYDYMTKKVFTLGIDKKLFVGLDIMNWAHVRHIPIVDRARRVVGIISHRDILKASISSVSTQVANLERDQHLWTISVESVMRKDVLTISSDASIQTAARLMRENKIGCLPVVDGGILVGIITEYDLLEIIEQMDEQL